MAEKYGIKIAGPDAEYEDGVKAVLDQIAGNPVGLVILAGIGATKKDVTIVPYDPGKVAVNGRCNASAVEDNVRDAAPEGVRGGVKGAGWYIGKEDNPRTREDDRYLQHKWKGGAGTGKGSSARIYFTPGISGGASCANKLGVYGSLEDEVLFHEMVHALRMTQGVVNAIPTEDSLRGYDNEEEFLAVVVANVYISAKASTLLRADHHGFRKLQAPLNTSAGFLANPENRRLLETYRGLWKPTFQELGRAGTPQRPAFNPFRQLEAEFTHMKAGSWQGNVRPSKVPIRL